MKKLYVVSSYYTLFIAIYDVVINKYDIDVILDCGLIDMKEIYNKLKKNKLFDNIYYIDDSDFRNRIFVKMRSSYLYSLCFFSNRRRLKDIGKVIEFNDKIVFDNYSDIVIFYPNSVYSLFLFGKNISCIFHEEGKYTLYNYLNRNIVIYKFYKIFHFLEKIKFFWGLPEGVSKYVKGYVTEDKGMKGDFIFGRPVHVEDKRNFSKLRLEYSDIMLDIFDVDKKVLTKGKKVLIATVYLYKGGYVSTEEAQLNIYKKIVDYYNRDGVTVFVKPHPLDDVCYESLKNCVVLEKDFPIEVLDFLDIEIDTFVTVVSSSVNNMTNIKNRYFCDISAIKNDDIDLTKFRKTEYENFRVR